MGWPFYIVLYTTRVHDKIFPKGLTVWCELYSWEFLEVTTSDFSFVRAGFLPDEGNLQVKKKETQVWG